MQVRRWNIALTGVLAVAALAASGRSAGRTLLVWNASPSTTEGLYAIDRFARPVVGDTVIARPPAWAARLAAERGYLPPWVPLVKTVVAASGDRVCASRTLVAVNGHAVAIRLAADAHGRSLPGWTGCSVIAPGELFLLGRGHPDSFDGRYFGPSAPQHLIGKARLIWAA